MSFMTIGSLERFVHIHKSDGKEVPVAGEDRFGNGDPRARTAMMARILSISTVYLGRLAKAGVLPEPMRRGEWNVVEVVHAYIRHLREDKQAASADERLEALRLAAARRAKTEAELEAIEAKNRIAKGEYVPLVMVR